jgi:hypothetical protein
VLQGWKIGRVRGAVALVIGALLGASVLAPTLGLAASFLTKKKADKRYLRKTDVIVAGNTSDATHTLNSISGYQSLIARSITAPKNGYLYIVGSASAEGAGINDFFRIRVNQRVVTDRGNAFGASTEAAPAAAYDYTVGLNAVVKVAKGNHSVHLEASHASTGASTFTGRSISVLFVPQGTAPDIPV